MLSRSRARVSSGLFDQSRAFYEGVIGLEKHGGLDWILFFEGDSREVQLNLMRLDIKADVHPDVSIEVDDVDAVYQRAVRAGCEIACLSPTKIGDCGDSSSETQTALPST
jgi:hypothetical protein